MATTRLQIGPADHGRVMTLGEFRDAEEEEGSCYELARGVLEVTEVPDDPHWQVVSNLQAMFYRHKAGRPGLIQRVGGGGECRVWMTEMVSGRNPDVAVVFKGAPADERGRQAPALVVEVVSRGSVARDYQDKRGDYLAFGVGEYWIVDPLRRVVTVLSRRDGAGGPSWSERLFERDEVIRGDLLPGFAGTVAGLWDDVDPGGPAAG